MWRSDKDKPGQRLLPSSSQQLPHAKATRPSPTSSSYFRELTNAWAPVVRKPVAPEIPEIAPDDPSLPAYLRHRPSTGAGPSAQKLFFRTKAVIHTKRPK